MADKTISKKLNQSMEYGDGINRKTKSAIMHLAEYLFR